MTFDPTNPPDQPIFGELQVSPSISITEETTTKTIEYTIIGTEDEDVALARALALAPLSVLVAGVGCVRSTIDMDHTGYNVYTASVNYESLDIPDSEDAPEGSSFASSFETGRGEIHLSRSLETKQIRTPDGNAPLDTFGGLIGVTQDAVEGVTLSSNSASFSFTETLDVPIENYTQAFVRTVAYATKKINNAPFRGFQPGEVLLDRVSGSTSDNFRRASFAFSFAVQENASNFSIGNISGINKRGWDYLWVRSADTTKTVGGKERLVKEPRFVCVERVYNEINFLNVLGYA